MKTSAADGPPGADPAVPDPRRIADPKEGPPVRERKPPVATPDVRPRFTRRSHDGTDLARTLHLQVPAGRLLPRGRPPTHPRLSIVDWKRFHYDRRHPDPSGRNAHGTRPCAVHTAADGKYLHAFPVEQRSGTEPPRQRDPL